MMAISSRNNAQWLPMFVVAFAGSGCAAASDCPEISEAFVISHWHGSVPRTVVVDVLKKGDGSQAPLRSIDYHGQLSGNDNQSLGIVLSLMPNSPLDRSLLAEDDYRILIDGKQEYRVHDIRMSDRVNLGCPIESATVNSCKIKPFRVIQVDSQCGTPLTADRKTGQLYRSQGLDELLGSGISTNAGKSNYYGYIVAE